MTGGYTNHYTTGDHSNAYHSKHPLFCSAIVALVVSLSLAQGAYMVKDLIASKNQKFIIRFLMRTNMELL